MRSGKSDLAAVLPPRSPTLLIMIVFPATRTTLSAISVSTPMTKLLRHLPWLSALLIWTILSGCNTTAFSSSDSKDYRPMLVQFNLESRDDSEELAQPLPISHIRVPMNPKAVLLAQDILGAMAVPTEHGTWLTFRLTSAATRDFYTTSMKNKSLRLVLSVNGVPIGVTTITTGNNTGRINIYPELKDDNDVAELVKDINATCADIQRRLK